MIKNWTTTEVGKYHLTFEVWGGDGYEYTCLSLDQGLSETEVLSAVGKWRSLWKILKLEVHQKNIEITNNSGLDLVWIQHDDYVRVIGPGGNFPEYFINKTNMEPRLWWKEGKMMLLVGMGHEEATDLVTQMETLERVLKVFKSIFVSRECCLENSILGPEFV